MVQLNSAKTTGTEKVIRLLLLGALIYGGMKLFNALAPTVISFATNIYRILILGVPLAFITLYVISNPFLIWTQYKRLCRFITSGFIKMDPLSIMKGYLEYLHNKKDNLDKVKVGLDGRRISLKRKLASLENDIKSNTELGRAALKTNEKQATQLGTFVIGDKESLTLFKNLYEEVDNKCTFLNSLSENWGYAIEGLERLISRKEEEYIVLRETVKALKEAKAFAQANEATRAYDESVKALEINVSEKLAFIDDFDQKVKPAMEHINLEKNVRAEKGLAALKALEDDKFMLPADFSMKSSITDLEYEHIPKKYDM